MKKRIGTKQELQAEIRRLLAVEQETRHAIGARTGELLDELRPASIIRNTYMGISNDPVLKRTLLRRLIASGAGLLGKKLIKGNSGNPVRATGGFLAEMAIRDLLFAGMTGLKKKRSAD